MLFDYVRIMKAEIDKSKNLNKKVSKKFKQCEFLVRAYESLNSNKLSREDREKIEKKLYRKFPEIDSNELNLAYLEAKDYLSKNKDNSMKNTKKTGTVWDKIKATTENKVKNSSEIPATFEVEVNGEKIWINSNSTEHLGEKMKENINLYKFDELDSTNDYLRRNHKSYEEFDVISARVQTHGKARRQNDWISMDGMALFSFFLKERDNWKIEDYLKLPLIAGLAVIKGLRKLENLEYKFKWTNDVYVENMKLCGILMEKTEDVYITGIGINVNNMLPENLKSKAISLTQIRNKKYEIDEVIKNIVSEFQILCEQLENGLWENILDKINKINYLKGKRIELKFGNEVVSGIAHNINKDGEIEVLMEQNEAGEREVRSFSVGEIFEKIVYY